MITGPNKEETPAWLDGLNRDWGELADGGLVWVQPPYGRGIIDWVKKAMTEPDEAICLLPARTDTQWFQRYAAHNSVTKVFLRGRLVFRGAHKLSPFKQKTCKSECVGCQSAPFPSLLLYHGPRRAWFAETWADKGVILA